MGTTATVSEHGRDRVRLETFTGLRGDQFGRLLNAARERGDEGCDWGASVAAAAGRVGAAGDRVLPNEPHRAAARSAVRRLAGDRYRNGSLAIGIARQWAVHSRSPAARSGTSGRQCLTKPARRAQADGRGANPLSKGCAR